MASGEEGAASPGSAAFWRAGPADAPSGGGGVFYCWSCGKACLPVHRFCASCGSRVVAPHWVHAAAATRSSSSLGHTPAHAHASPTRVAAVKRAAQAAGAEAPPRDDAWVRAASSLPEAHCPDRQHQARGRQW